MRQAISDHTVQGDISNRALDDETSLHSAVSSYHAAQYTTSIMDAALIAISQDGQASGSVQTSQRSLHTATPHNRMPTSSSQTRVTPPPPLANPAQTSQHQRSSAVVHHDIDQRARRRSSQSSVSAHRNEASHSHQRITFSADLHEIPWAPPHVKNQGVVRSEHAEAETNAGALRCTFRLS